MNKSNSFNIVIYPSNEVSQKAIRLSKQLKENGGLFTLDKKKYFPHITLYMVELPLKNLNQAKKVLKDCASKTKSFNVKSLKYRQNKDGFIDINYKDKRIKNLQKNVINLFNPLRDGLIRETEKVRLNKLNKKEKKNVLLYGYRNVGSNFSPHLTFTKLEKFDKKILSRIKKDNFSFKVDKIGFFYLGKHGTCNKLVKTYKFI